MDDYSNRRSRKSKLVPREYLDSDDEIAFMQQELEQELAKLKASSILKKLHTNKEPPKKAPEFSIKIEVEEVDEQTPREVFDVTFDPPRERVEHVNPPEELAIRIDSVRTLCKTESTTKPNNATTTKVSTTLKEPTKELTTSNKPTTSINDIIITIPAQVKESISNTGSSKQKESTYLKEATILNKPNTLNDSTVFKEPTKVKEFAKIGQSFKQKELTNLKGSSKIGESSKHKESTNLKESTKIGETSKQKGPTSLKASTEIGESSKQTESTYLKESTKIGEPSKQSETTYLKESTKIGESSKQAESTYLKESTKIEECSKQAESTYFKESPKIEESSKQAESTYLKESTKIVESSEQKVLTNLKESLKIEESSEQKESTYLKEPTKLDEPTTSNDSTIFKVPARVTEPTKPPPVIAQPVKPTVHHYLISDEVLKHEISEVSKKTTEKADKLLEVHIKNYFGRVDNDECLSSMDVELQAALQLWKVWQENYPSIRDAPLVYICYACDKGWWNFYNFRRHVKRHRDEINFGVEADVFSHEYVIVAYIYRKPFQHSVFIEDNCWRCEKNLQSHRVNVYKCTGCDRNFMTCLQLAVHQGNCNEYRRMFFDKNGTRFTFLVYGCSVCQWKHWSEEKLQQHMISYHTVRSDMPISWAANPCARCNQLCTHDKRRCSKIVKDCYYCMFCSRKFYSKYDLNIHNMMTPHKFKCRVCQKVLKKACVEESHLLEHSEVYTSIYKCILCLEPVYFIDEEYVKAHKNNFHRKKAKSVCNCFDKVTVPKSLLSQIKPLQDSRNVTKFGRSKSKFKKNLVQNTYENACQDLVGYLDTTPPVTEITPQEAPVFQTPNSIVFDNNMGVQITILDKRTVQEIMNSSTIVQMPDVINIKQEVLNDESCAGNVEKFLESSKEISKSIINNMNGMYDEIPVIKQEPVEDEEMNEDILNSMLHIEDGNLPIKFEVKEEEEDFEDDIINLNQACSSTSVQPFKGCRKKRKMTRTQKFEMPAITDREAIRLTQDNYVRMVHEEIEYFCTKCFHKFSSFQKYLAHFVNHAYNRFACPKCLRQCHDIFDLMRHVNFHIKNSFVCIRAIKLADDLQENGFQCKVCMAVLMVKEFFQHWEHHLDIKYGEERLQEFSVDMDKKPLLKEMLTILMDPERTLKSITDGFERGKKVKKCNSCHMTFDRKNDYKRHFIEHLLTDAYSERPTYGNLRCQICGTGFNKSDAYKRHLRDHGSLPVYKCEICDKSFSDSSNFSKHKKVHNLSVLVCDICGKKFNAKHYLIRHLGLHEVLKPINCKNCDKVFYSRTAFNKHMRNYNKSYKCMSCSEVFGSLRDKWEHQWIEHKERKFQADCPICGEEFRRYRDVKKHLRDEHDYIAPKKNEYTLVNEDDSS